MPSNFSESHSYDDSSNASGNSKELHALLTNTQFALLVVFSGVCHYVALIVSALTVGESTGTLTLPFVVVKKLLMGFVSAITSFLKRRRERVFVGVGYEDDGASVDRFDAMNQPSEVGHV
ncbi:hypothetical protein C3747_120g589c [Trypanosoma cruzi]|uniref:Uncharacterized protein n=2 Tax=Trypanosoma cruzi TaxID=5693 RepID=Q4DAN4_TRYCC|nr:hypothetical protein, conserved [Trypanosoma cruzi]EAN89576.1 hypothetical protein, conserved [Trypanosoma cruzi]PWV06076.1 hypothetical protein C3747_120g589c [Trypanosoma cruzi]RNC48274.1 hypothetical protein TcCL_NonESM01871 [Trypanosoma cruzi]|eukprot:XP_811427.1 hypothetical protein [Trypanosoma cruzi strain CL Brener]